MHAHGLIEDPHAGWLEYTKAGVTLVVVVGVIAGVVLAWARPVFGGHEVLRLSEREMTLVSVDFGVTWRTRVFAPGDVRGVEYKVVSSSDTGDEYAIEFRGCGRRVRMFRNASEQVASDIMTAMRRYGYTAP